MNHRIHCFPSGSLVAPPTHTHKGQLRMSRWRVLDCRLAGSRQGFCSTSRNAQDGPTRNKPGHKCQSCKVKPWLTQLFFLKTVTRPGTCLPGPGHHSVLAGQRVHVAVFEPSLSQGLVRYSASQQVGFSASWKNCVNISLLI